MLLILIYIIIFTLFNYNIIINKESVHANTFIWIIAIQWIRIPPFPHSHIPPFPHSPIPVPYFKDSHFRIVPNKVFWLSKTKNEKRNLFQNSFLLFKEFKVKIEYGFSFFKRLENGWPFHQFMICPVGFSRIVFEIEKRKHEFDDWFSFFMVSKNEWPLDTRICKHCWFFLFKSML